MYSLEKREQSFFSDTSFSWDLDFSRTGGRLNRGRLFFLMGSVIGFVLVDQMLTDIGVILLLSKFLNLVQ